MVHKIEVSIDVIVHATEDIMKIFQAFEDIFDLKEEDFSIEEVEGHYKNPIIVLKANIVKKQAQKLISDLLRLLPAQQVDELIEQIEERTVDSRFHLRLDKQKLIKGDVIVREKDTIKLKIHSPIYNKKDTVKIFTEIFQILN